MSIFRQIKNRLGDLWWYTILLFVAQRIGDVINMFVGLWLVPRYVPMEELGAVLPITAFVGVLALPLTIVALPFQKFLAFFNMHGRIGRVKALLRDVFVGTAVLALVTFAISYFVLPFFFERIRVVSGSLGLLMLGVSVFSAVSGIFANAVTGLKRFDANVWFTLLGAPIRLVVMLVAMPFRALSGYVLGQGAPNGVSIVGALWVLRDIFGKQVKCEPYWKEYGRSILLYTAPFAVLTIANAISGSIDSLVIRHRLSDFESAGYYLISRFSDIAGYIGVIFPAMMFPLVASKKKRDSSAERLLRQSVLGTFVCGVLVTLSIYLGGRLLLGLTETWKTYQSLYPHMTLMAATTTLSVMVNCFMTFEMAQGRFRFLWYLIPIVAIKSVLLYAVTGYTFFTGMLPDAWLTAIAEFNPCRLRFILEILFVAQVTLLGMFIADICWMSRSFHHHNSVD